jgi:hypothetical protein
VNLGLVLVTKCKSVSLLTPERVIGRTILFPSCCSPNCILPGVISRWTCVAWNDSARDGGEDASQCASQRTKSRRLIEFLDPTCWTRRALDWP